MKLALAIVGGIYFFTKVAENDLPFLIVLKQYKPTLNWLMFAEDSLSSNSIISFCLCYGFHCCYL